MSAGSINASNESPANSASSTRVSSPGSYVPFLEPQLLSQPIPIPINQNNSTAGVPRQLSAGNTPYPRAPDGPIKLNIPLGRLSPQSVHNAIATTNLDPPTLRTIIDALVETSNSHHQQYQCQVQAQDEEHKATVEKLKEDLKYAESRLLDYQETFVKAPEGYRANDRLPTFTIPLGEGLDIPAKWIKQLDDGRTAGYSEHDGTGDLSYVKEIYTAPQDLALDPPEVLPHWIWETLQGASIQYQEFRRAVRDLDDWGLYAEVLHYHQLDEDILSLKAQLDLNHASLAAAQNARLQSITRLEAARLPKQISHMAAPIRASPSTAVRGAWKKGRGRPY